MKTEIGRPTKQKIVYIISGLDFSFGILWVSQFLDKEKFEQVYVFLNSNKPILYIRFIESGIKSYYFEYSGKRDIPKTLIMVTKVLIKERPTIVHTHLFDASLIGLFASRVLGIKKRIYTRHHSTIHHQYFPKIVKYDKFINSNATDIIAISKNVSYILTELEGVKKNKITIINHGFDLEAFSNPDKEKIENIRTKIGLKNSHPVIGVISRYTYWKGVQYVIPAFKAILEKYPDAKLILANSNGDYSTEIKFMLKDLPPDSWVDMPFEIEIFALYALFDIFVHVPIDAEAEAFGQTYVESLAAGIPSIFTLSGIAREFIVDKENALIVPFKDVNAIKKAIFLLLENEELKLNLSKKGHESVSSLYGLGTMKMHIEKLYND